MKKLLGIVILGLLLSGNAYAEQFKAHVKNFYNSEISFYGNSKKNFDEAKTQAFQDCRKNADENKLDSNGCLLYALQSHTAWQTLTGQEYEEVFWDKEVAKFEKKIADKKKKVAEKKQNKANDLAATLYYWGLSTDKISMYFFGNRNQNNLQGTMAIVDENYLPWHGIFGISAKDYEKFDITVKTKSGTSLEFIGKNKKKTKG